MKQVDTSVQDDARTKQMDRCPEDQKVALVITGHFERDGATFYNFTSYSFDGTKNETSYRYSQLYDFNQSLIRRYGNIRMLREFPPKKLNKKDEQIVSARLDSLQIWCTELIWEPDTREDDQLQQFFKLRIK